MFFGGESELFILGAILAIGLGRYGKLWLISSLEFQNRPRRSLGVLPGCCDLAKVPEEMWMIDDAWSPYGSVFRLFISIIGKKMDFGTSDW